MLRFQRIPGGNKFKYPFFGPEFVIEGYKMTYTNTSDGNGGGETGCPFDDTTWSTLNAMGNPGGFLWSAGILATDVAGTEYFELYSSGGCNASQQPASITLAFTCGANDTSLEFSVLDGDENTLGTNNGIFSAGANTITINMTYDTPSLHIAFIRIVHFGWEGTITNIIYV